MSQVKDGDGKSGFALTALHAAVDRLVLAHGAFIPMELLLREGWLRYADYEAWRCGEVDAIDEMLIGDPTLIHDRLQRAVDWAARLGLQPEMQTYRGWGTAAAGRPLCCCRHGDRAGEALFCTHYVRPRENDGMPQMDLFLDNETVVLVNQLVEALVARGTDQAEVLLKQLQSAAPKHRLCGPLGVLCKAQRSLQTCSTVARPEEELESLVRHIAPLAEEALGTRARDFLTPHWRRLAGALKGAPFHPARPRLHASWVYGRTLDWAVVRASVLAEPGWQRQPWLRARLAEALCRLGERDGAISQWCNLCWQCPKIAAQVLGKADLPDLGIARAWKQFLDLDVEPVLETPWFPAWLLLHEPGLVRILRADKVLGTAPGRAFQALQCLLRGDGADVGKDAIALRAALKAEHAGLLALYLQQVERGAS